MNESIKKINYFEFIIEKEINKFSKLAVFENMINVTSKYSENSPEIFDLQFTINEENMNLLLDTVNKLQLKKWKKSYCNYKVKNGKYWSLKIMFNDNKTPKSFYGINEYPIIYDGITGLRPFSSTSYSTEFTLLLKNLNKISGKRSLFK